MLTPKQEAIALVEIEDYPVAMAYTLRYGPSQANLDRDWGC